MKRVLACVKPAAIRSYAGLYERRMPEHTQQEALGLSAADMAALEAALACKEDAVVTVLSMGIRKAAYLLRELLERGADEAVLISDILMEGSDTYATAVVLAAAISKLGGFDLILCGRKSADGETGQVPGELSGLTGIPCVTNVTGIEALKQTVRGKKRTENGIAEVETPLPAILTLCEDSYTLRLPGILEKRKAAEKEIRLLGAADLGISNAQCGLSGSKTQVIKTIRMDSGVRKCFKEMDMERGILELIKEIGEAEE